MSEGTGGTGGTGDTGDTGVPGVEGAVVGRAERPLPPAVRFPGEPVLVGLAAGIRYVRIYDARYYVDGGSFRFFGPQPGGRFDHHPAGPPRRQPGHGILYAAAGFRCAVAEVFGDRRRVAPADWHRLAILATTQRLTLVDVRDQACIPLGVPAGAMRTRDRPLTQKVARALHAATDADGLLYEGWFTGDTCVALWERSRPAVSVVDDRALDDLAVLPALLVTADELHYAVPPW